MKDKVKLLVLVLVFALVIGGAYILYQRLSSELAPDSLTVQTQTTPTAPPSVSTHPPTEESQTETDPPVSLAPDFTVYDAQGNQVNLYDYLGKPIVVNFWASWCGPCKMEMPDFNEKYLELGDEIQFLMINMTDGSRETVEIASDFITQQGYEFPVFFDTTSEAAITYGAYSLPTTYFIDAQGYAIAKAVGAIDAETLQRGIDMITH